MRIAPPAVNHVAYPLVDSLFLAPNFVIAALFVYTIVKLCKRAPHTIVKYLVAYTCIHVTRASLAGTVFPSFTLSLSAEMEHFPSVTLNFDL